MRAKDLIYKAMKDCLPDGVPLPFIKINKAKFIGNSKNKPAIAEVEMFDKKTATLRVAKWADFEGAWTLSWLNLEGGSINWNGKCWERVNNSVLGCVESA